MHFPSVTMLWSSMGWSHREQSPGGAFSVAISLPLKHKKTRPHVR